MYPVASGPALAEDASHEAARRRGGHRGGVDLVLEREGQLLAVAVVDRRHSLRVVHQPVHPPAVAQVPDVLEEALHAGGHDLRRERGRVEPGEAGLHRRAVEPARELIVIVACPEVDEGEAEVAPVAVDEVHREVHVIEAPAESCQAQPPHQHVPRALVGDVAEHRRRAGPA
eukprot:CAMPEP_0179264874 /NCGR_PEP_ID=MMETSP0797-20121207/28614_1 /TAXON_ID=47934 /ORGANISM="Dinophysis acuminata, Strain DAEP01" /LENGTH=171 /DNA_ID=CAMNT_0020973067 /DNA_START=41 /DNA_END=553 /DNA_ORIENTATION=-